LRKLKSILYFELKHAVNKRNGLVFFAIAIILQIFLQVGKTNYNDILESNKTFQRQEQQKTSSYAHNVQYGSFGIWIKFIPDVKSIFYFDSTCDNLLCNANSTYVFNTYTPFKGRRLFAYRSHFLNFSAMFFLLGALACLIYGEETTVRKDYLNFISNLTGSKKAFWFTVTARLMILFLATLVLYAISVLPLLVFDGINLFKTTFTGLLVIILVFFFFFSIGCLVGLKKSKFTRGLILGAVYFIMAILLPWLMGLYGELSAKDMPSLIEFDYQNFDVLMQEEENQVKDHGPSIVNKVQGEDAIKDFKKKMRKMKKIFRSNEDSLKSQSIDKIKAQKTISSLIPTLFYFSTWESSSSIGADSYIDFHTYCQELKDGFTDFITDNTFEGKDQTISKNVVNFIKGDEDLFFSKPKLPYNFWLGVFLTPFYTVIILFLTFGILKKRMKVSAPSENYLIENEKYNPIFVLCETKAIKEDIFNQYKNQDNTVCLEKISTDDFQFYGIKPHDLFRQFCQLNGGYEKKAQDNLELMGIRNLKGLPETEEILLKIYAAVATAADFDKIVINDFLKKESREFENSFVNLLTSLETSGKKVIYLSCQMKQHSIRLEETIKIKGFEAFPLNFQNDSLR